MVNLRFLDGRNDGVDKLWNVAVDLGSFEHGFYGATGTMAHHDKQRSTEMAGTVFNGADFIGLRDVAGDADDEEISEPLVEDGFSRYAGVGTSENCSEWILPFRYFGATLRREIGVNRFAGGEANVAQLQILQRFGR